MCLSVNLETLIRGGKKHVSKNVLTIAHYDYPNYLLHIYSMISRFDAHCDSNIVYLLLTLSVPVIMAVFFYSLELNFVLETYICVCLNYNRRS